MRLPGLRRGLPQKGEAVAQLLYHRKAAGETGLADGQRSPRRPRPSGCDPRGAAATSKSRIEIWANLERQSVQTPSISA
jgi:hypothetical protein